MILIRLILPLGPAAFPGNADEALGIRHAWEAMDAKSGHGQSVNQNNQTGKTIQQERTYSNNDVSLKLRRTLYVTLRCTALHSCHTMNQK